MMQLLSSGWVKPLWLKTIYHLHGRFNNFFHIFQTKALGSITLTATSTSDVTGTSTGTAATNAELIARFNLIEAVINGYATPDC